MIGIGLGGRSYCNYAGLYGNTIREYSGPCSMVWHSGFGVSAFRI